MKTFNEFLQEKKLDIKIIDKKISPILNKLNVIGTGLQAIAYNSKKKDSVIKLIYISGESDPVYQFLRICVNNSNNPYLPKIYNYKMYNTKVLSDEENSIIDKLTKNANSKIKEEDFILFVVMEKLQSIKSLSKSKQLELIKNTDINSNKKYFNTNFWNYFIQLFDYKEEYNGSDKNLKNVLRLLKPLIQKYSNDLDDIGNIMIRDGKQIVILDPVANIEKDSITVDETDLDVVINQQEVEDKLIDNTLDNTEIKLLQKYKGIINNRNDLLKLSVEERNEIKSIFVSEFRFLSMLQK